MKLWTAAWLAAILFAASAAANVLPIYIEDNHAGTFYWLAQQIDLEEPYTLIHFDAHSDASGIFDSDKMRDALRHVASKEDRQTLLDRWRREGAIQCFNWIEPLMPAPIAKVIWVPSAKIVAKEFQARRHEATKLLDGHLEAAPRKSGTFRERYVVSNLENLQTQLNDNQPIIATIDLDYFSGMPAAEQAAAFQRVWNFVIEQRKLRAITFAISRPYLDSEDEAHRLLKMTLSSALSLPTARIEFAPYATVANDRSARARELHKTGISVPIYEITRAPEDLRARILAEQNRILVRQDRTRWERLLRDWQAGAPQLHLEIKDAQLSTDGVWRLPVAEQFEVKLLVEPWMAKLDQIEWFALTPRYASCNVSELGPSQVGFVANAAPRPAWNEIRIHHSGNALSLYQIDQFFDRQLHSGSLRLRARASVGGKIRETPVMELRRFAGLGFRAAVSEQFGLPYLFGGGQLAIDTDTGPETNLGADCANFIAYAMRRQGLRIPWSDPKQLRQYVDLDVGSVPAGRARFTAAELDDGLIVHLGSHVAAVMEDRAPFGVLDGNDIVAHQLKGVPETLTLAELLRERKTENFDLVRVPNQKTEEKIIFGGDVMLGRSAAARIEQGIDPFAGLADLLTHSSFAAANLECTISTLGRPRPQGRYSFRAPSLSANLLRANNFRAVGLANNHALDFGAAALRDCAERLRQQKIEPVGDDDVYAPHIFSLSSKRKLALLAITDVGRGDQAASDLDRTKLSASLIRAHTEADFVACLVHWGNENVERVTDRQRELARWLVDNEVDLVVGSHPHCLQPLDFYHGRPIAYSLGNLVFDGAPTVASWNRGALLEVSLSDQAKVSSIRTIPIELEDGFPKIAPKAVDGVVAKE